MNWQCHRVATCLQSRNPRRLCASAPKGWGCLCSQGSPDTAWTPPALLHCLARSSRAHMALCPAAGKGGTQEAGCSQPQSLRAHPIPCSQSTPNTHGWHLAACRAQQRPSSLKTGPAYGRGGNGDGTTMWGFFS